MSEAIRATCPNVARAATGAPGGPESTDLASSSNGSNRLLLGGPRRYTRAAVVRSGGDVDRAGQPALAGARFRRRSATIEVVFTDGDAQALRQVGFLTENLIVDDELRVAITRLLGQTFSRLASWQGQLLVETASTTQPDLLRLRGGRRSSSSSRSFR